MPIDEYVKYVHELQEVSMSPSFIFKTLTCKVGIKLCMLAKVDHFLASAAL